MIRELIISCIIHLMVVAFVMRMPQTPPLEIGRVGERIEVRMTSSKAGTPSEAKKGSGSEDQKKRVEKKPEKKVEEKREEKKVEKKVERKPVEKPKKKAEKVEKKLEEKVEEKPEVVAASEAAEEITKDASEEVAADNLTAKEESEEAVEGTGSEDRTAGALDGNEQLDEGVIRLSDGSLYVKHQGVKGTTYGFVSTPLPAYPNVAKRLGFKEEIVIKVLLQFDSNGNLEKYKFVGERDKFGFTNEVEKVLKNWKLTPIRYKGEPTGMGFYKSFKFSIENS